MIHWSMFQRHTIADDAIPAPPPPPDLATPWPSTAPAPPRAAAPLHRPACPLQLNASFCPTNTSTQNQAPAQYTAMVHTNAMLNVREVFLSHQNVLLKNQGWFSGRLYGKNSPPIYVFATQTHNTLLTPPEKIFYTQQTAINESEEKHKLGLMYITINWHPGPV